MVMLVSAELHGYPQKIRICCEMGEHHGVEDSAGIDGNACDNSPFGPSSFLRVSFGE